MYQIKEKSAGYSILFSVDKRVEHIYNTLKNIIGSNAYVAQLKSKQTEAINLIERLYKNITSNVELTFDLEKSEFVQVKFRVMCDGKNWRDGSKCTFNEIKEINFEAVIKLIKCPDLKRNEKFKIGINFN